MLSIIIILVIILILLLFIIRNNKLKMEKFDNLEDNLYTFDTCCTEKQKQQCMTYGKTGNCNYNKNIGSCFCQNAF